MIIPPMYQITNPYRDYVPELHFYQARGNDIKAYGQGKRKSYKNKQRKNKRRKK